MKATWRRAAVNTFTFGGSTWVMPVWSERSELETFNEIAGSSKLAADVARALRLPVWWYEYFERSTFFATADRYGSDGVSTHHFSADQDLAAFEAMAHEMAPMIGWPANVFGDLVELAYLAGGPWTPDPESVPDDVMLEVRFELPSDLLEAIRAAALEADRSLSVLAQRLCARSDGVTVRSYVGEIVPVRLFFSGKQWKALCTVARASGMTPSQVFIARAQQHPIG